MNHMHRRIIMHRFTPPLVLLAGVLAFSVPALAQHDADTTIGRNSANQLVADCFSDPNPLDPIDPANPLGLHGWSAGEPGFHSLFAPDVVPPDFVRLDSGASIYIEV